MVDSHCHLADDAFVADLGDVAARAQAAGIARALCILSADEPGEVARVETVRAVWPSILFAAGIHPHRTGAFAGRLSEAVAVTREAVASSRAVVVGEIGLDYHYDHSPREVQRAVFAGQLQLAADLGLPVAIHTREAFGDTMAILREQGAGLRVVIHCFSETLQDARHALDSGYYLSLAGIVTFPKAATLREVAAFVPSDQLLTETDAPFLAPVPLRGKRNEPAWVRHTAQAIAAERRVPATTLVEQITQNFDKFMGLGT